MHVLRDEIWLTGEVTLINLAVEALEHNPVSRELVTSLHSNDIANE
jgi:hypothetical protein